MKVAVIGLGSMGRRRARLLLSLGVEVVGVDLEKTRREQAQRELQISTYESLQAASAAIALQAAVISTPPLSHSKIVRECLDENLHVFTELNLVGDGYEENQAIAEKKNLVWFPSSTFVYRREIEAIRDLIGNDRCGAWTYHVGQYLPDWHPWEDYRNFFVADARTSGIRELLAIELPWLVGIFGPIKKVHHATQKISGLDIPYDDAAALVVVHENGAIGTLLIDVVCRKAVRDFTFTNENSYITWDGSPSGLKSLDLNLNEMMEIDVYGKEGADQLDDYARFIVEDAYRSELAAFLGAIEGASSVKWSLDEDAKIIALIDDLEGRA